MADAAYEVERFRRYIAAFNAHDYASLVDHYDPNVLIVIGNGTELRGRQAVVDFYSKVNAQTTREIRILDAFSDGAMVGAEIESEFLAIEDAPDFSSGPMAKGDRLYINSFALYDIRGGRYARIRAAVFRRQWKRVAEGG